MKTLHIDENLLEYKDLVSLPVTHDVVLFDLKYGIRESFKRNGFIWEKSRTCEPTPLNFIDFGLLT